MKYRLQNRYQDSSWEWMTEAFDTEVLAIAYAKECACKPIHYGMVRVISPKGKVVVEYGAGEGIDKGWETHTSPNGAEPGSYVHDAEKWMLKQGLKIPVAGRHRHMFQGMLDDYSESK